MTATTPWPYGLCELQVWYLNHLLGLPPDRFTERERAFLVLLSTKLRYTVIKRQESQALEALAHRMLGGGDPTYDPGIPNTFNGIDVRPEPETEHTGGPGGTRPAGTGNGLEPLGLGSG